MINRSNTAVINDSIYVLRIDDTLLVKRLIKQPNQMIKVCSDNSFYDSYIIDDTTDAQIIGRVVLTIRRI